MALVERTRSETVVVSAVHQGRSSVKEGEHMSKLQQHYYNFQSLPTIPEKILYLQKHSKDLYQYNINVRNLIRAWSTNDWPHLRPKQEHPGF